MELVDGLFKEYYKLVILEVFGELSVFFFVWDEFFLVRFYFVVGCCWVGIRIGCSGFFFNIVGIFSEVFFLG